MEKAHESKNRLCIIYLQTTTMNRHRLFNSFYKPFLVLTVIVFILIFFTPFNKIFNRRIYHPRILYSKTHISNHDTSLCIDNIRPRYVETQRECPRGGIVTVHQGGRLGNQIWEYASVWAVAKLTGLQPIVPGCIRNTIDQLFANLTVPTFEDIIHCQVLNNEVVRSLDDWRSPNQSIVLPIYARLFRETVPYLREIPVEFKLREDLVERCQEVLRAAAVILSKPTTTFVGVHVRRTDYMQYLQWKYQNPNITVADPAYFLGAMEVFEQKYDDVIFVVVSDDLSWCRKAFSKKSNVFISMQKNSAVMDLALMASCNHTIYDYGTYGDWGSLLAGGETIYFDLKVNPSAQLGKMIPNWSTISME